jgi:hypothetical protein
LKYRREDQHRLRGDFDPERNERVLDLECAITSVWEIRGTTIRKFDCAAMLSGTIQLGR